jgi:hypothetical protein
LAVITGTPSTSNRVTRSFDIRVANATHDKNVGEPPQIDNGDEARYADKSGTYTKGIKQASIGIVVPAAYQTFKNALSTGDPLDFENIMIGGTMKLNDPQGGLAFNLDCLDNAQFTKPPAPAVRTDEYATELVEMYWASLLRDVPFAEYPHNPIAKDAAANLSSLLSSYKGPRDNGKVTPELLFRGGLADVNAFEGETVGPYISQFLIQKTHLGATDKERSGLPIDQKYVTFEAHRDFMLDPTIFKNVQNGIDTGISPSLKEPLYLHNGRGLAALTHNDVLYEEFLMVDLVLNSLGAPLNPGTPYAKGNPYTKTQKGFNTFGGPDIESTFAAVARNALNVVWYQKWYIHLRHRPEAGGGLVYAKKSNQNPLPQAAGELNYDILKEAVDASFAKNKSYLLSQAFPEGSPTHPAYPTGHGTVAGACITVLKFFFDGDFIIPNPKEPTKDGKDRQPYTGGKELRVNGELHKLAHNVTFGHGIHAGIHWRSDSDASIQLGEEVALSFLWNRAQTCNEKFTVNLKKVDGSTATISNQ